MDQVPYFYFLSSMVFEVDVFDLPSSFFIASTSVKILTYSQDIKRAKEKQKNEMESTKQYI